MSLDSVARSASSGLRDSVGRTVVPSVARRRLDATLRSRRRARSAAALVAVVASLGLAAALVARPVPQEAPASPDGATAELRWEMCTATTPDPCAGLPPGRYHASAPTPVTLTVPDTFDYWASPGQYGAFDLRDGVRIVVVPAVSPNPLPGAAAPSLVGPSALATWMASQPGVTLVSQASREVDGRDAVRLVVDVDPARLATRTCGWGDECSELLHGGPSSGLTPWRGRYIWDLVDLGRSVVLLAYLRSDPVALPDDAFTSTADAVTSGVSFPGPA